MLKIGELHVDINQEALNFILGSEDAQMIFHLFEQYIGHLRTNNGQLSEFWVSYLDMMGIFLGMVRASREGNWILHLACVQKMLPWCIAYDRRNYAKYQSVYLSDMSSLEDKHPGTYQHFLNGGFSVQIGDKNPFGKIPLDQAIEETVNKDTQTAGGIKEFSLKPSALKKYYLTVEYRSSCLHKFREMINLH